MRQAVLPQMASQSRGPCLDRGTEHGAEGPGWLPPLGSLLWVCDQSVYTLWCGVCTQCISAPPETPKCRAADLVLKQGRDVGPSRSVGGT